MKNNSDEIMKKILLITLSMILSMLPAMAKYTIHSTKGDVKVERAGKLIPVTKGMEVSATDNIHIATGAKVEILNSVNSKIFTSTRSGEFNVTRIMIDAQIKAKDHGANVGGNLQMTRFGKQKDSNPMWVQKGKVTRTMEKYDPTAEKTQTDPGHLARWILATMATPGNTTRNFPVKVSHHASSDSSLNFTLENTLDFPVYFNILKTTGDSIPTIDISELGQPMGSYVVLPGQSISREQFRGISPAEKHLLILTPYYFDIDELLPRIRATEADPAITFDDETPAFMLTL